MSKENVVSSKVKKSFPERDYGFNAERDIQAVLPDDLFDLHSAFINGMLPDNVSVPDADYDGNEEPESIIGRPSNEFEALHLSKTVADAFVSKDSKDNPNQ